MCSSGLGSWRGRFLWLLCQEETGRWGALLSLLIWPTAPMLMSQAYLLSNLMNFYFGMKEPRIHRSTFSTGANRFADWLLQTPYNRVAQNLCNAMAHNTTILSCISWCWQPQALVAGRRKREEQGEHLTLACIFFIMQLRLKNVAWNLFGY